MWSQVILAISASASLATALAVPSTHVVHEERDSVSSRWTKRSRVSPDAILPVRIGLAQSNLDKAHDYLMDVSDPASPNFGKHWTADEVTAAFQPSDETLQAVKQWLADAGIDEYTHADNKAWYAFDAPAGQVEALLHAEYFEYEDEMTGGVLPSCDRYHVPQHIQKHIDYITPGLKLLAPHVMPEQRRRKRSDKTGKWPGYPKAPLKPWKPAGEEKQTFAQIFNNNNLSYCDYVITPGCIAALYNIPPAILPPNPTNKLGIYEADLQFYDQQDLDQFFSTYTIIPNGTHPSSDLIDGGKTFTPNPEDAGGEFILDLQIAYPIVYPQSIVVFDENDLHYQSFNNDTSSFGFNQLLDAIDGSYCTYSAFGETGDAPGIDPSYPDPTPGTGYNHTLQCGVFKPTNVISVSYGGQEYDVPIAYQRRQCNEFLKLGLQGVTFLYASGDTGVAQYSEEQGGYDGPTGCLGPQLNVFNPTWPNTCPYLTSVGATKLYPGNSVFERPQPESVVYDPAGHPYLANYSSGGGFSNIFAIPDYQKSAVAAYFKNHNPPYPYYSALAPNVSNPTRVDIAALQGNTGGLYNRIGRGYPDVSANGDNIANFFAGEFVTTGGTSAATPLFASVINRIIEARLAIGKGPIGFLNPTLYKNAWALNDITNGTNVGCNTNGFPAAPGWDPSSGLGTPNFPKLLALYLSLP